MASILNVDKIRATGSTTDGIDCQRLAGGPAKIPFAMVNLAIQYNRNSTNYCSIYTM